MNPALPPLAERILFRLEQAELAESNPHFRDDHRIAWITVLHAARGSSSPHTFATYAVLGRSPQEVWTWIVSWRKAKLGNEYSAWYDADGNLRPEVSHVPPQQLPPKKPVQMELCFYPRQRPAV